MTERRKRRKKEKKKPASKRSIISGTVSLAGLILYFLIIIFSVIKRGETNEFNYIPGIMAIFFVLSLSGLTAGIPELKKSTEFSAFSRWFGFILPVLSLIFYVSTYIVGFLRG